MEVTRPMEKNKNGTPNSTDQVSRPHMVFRLRKHRLKGNASGFKLVLPQYTCARL